MKRAVFGNLGVKVDIGGFKSLSLDPHPKIINGIYCCNWREGIAAIRR